MIPPVFNSNKKVGVAAGLVDTGCVALSRVKKVAGFWPVSRWGSSVGQGLVWPDGVVFEPVGLGLAGKVEPVCDLIEEQALVFQRPEASFAGAVLAGERHARSHVPQFWVLEDERFEPGRAERPAVVGDQGAHWQQFAVGDTCQGCSNLLT